MLLSLSRNVKKYFKFACLICPFGPKCGKNTIKRCVPLHCTQPRWLGCSLGVLAMMKYDFQRHGTINTHNGGASLTGDLLSFYPRSGPSSVVLTIFFWVVCFISNSIDYFFVISYSQIITVNNHKNFKRRLKEIVSTLQHIS